MNAVKDLLYSAGNLHLDIARLSTFLSILAFWGMVIWHHAETKEFDPVAVGGGTAAIFTAGAGWIYFRKKQEGQDGPGDAQSGG